MSHRQKGHHKPRHHTHPIKPASLYLPENRESALKVLGTKPELTPKPEPHADVPQEESTLQG